MTPTEVQLWAVRLTAPANTIATYQSLLSPEEKARAARFAFPRDRESYALSQGALRLLLSGYLEAPVHEIEIHVDANGKPSLGNKSRLKFNKSHSKGLALYALTQDCPIGVDVEQVRELPDFDHIASHYFCSCEAVELSSLSTMNERQEAFFRCWTRKEAYIKAIGAGLSMPLDQFQVTLLSEDPVRFVHIGNDEHAALEWRLHHLAPAVGYVGAIAYSGRERTIRFHGRLDCDDLLTKFASLGSV